MHKKQIFILALLAGINFTNIMDFMVMMPLGPQLKRVFLLSPPQWSFLVSSYTFAAFISGVLSVFYIDRIDRKVFLLIAYTGFVIGTLFCAQANTFEALVTARIVAGLFGGMLGSVILAMVGDLVEFQHRAKAMGIVMIGFSGAAALGVPTGIYFAAKYNWQMPFMFLTVLATILLVISYFVIPTIPPQPKETRGSVWENLKLVFGESNKNISLIYFSLLVFSQFLVIPFLSPFLVSNAGFKEVELMNIYLFGGLFTIVTSPLVGKIADQLGRIKVFIVLACLSTIPIYLMTHLDSKNMVYIIMISVLFFVFVGGRAIPAMSIVLSTAEPKIRGSFMSIRSAFQQLVSGLAAYISGHIIVENADGSYGNYGLIGYISMVCCLLTIPLVMRIKEKF